MSSIRRNERGLLLVISGPSGVGKGTVLTELRRDNPNLFYSVSATTRSPRPGEEDGVNYFFLTKEEFERRIADGGMLEYACYSGNFYGTPRDAVERMRDEGKDVILEIEVQGAMQVMEKEPDAISIMILPPSFAELSARLRGRKTETEEVIEKRLAAARGEIECGEKYTYLIVNDSVLTAKDEIAAIIRAEKIRRREKETMIHEVLLSC